MRFSSRSLVLILTTITAGSGIACAAASGRTGTAAAVQPAAATAAPSPAKPVVKGETAMNSDPVNLPAAGKAPPPVEVGADFASVWNAPLKTLSGKPTHLSEYKGKAL